LQKSGGSDFEISHATLSAQIYKMHGQVLALDMEADGYLKLQAANS
jgi:hypothetical protein